jgi:1D-myo-inositol 3-kinase
VNHDLQFDYTTVGHVTIDVLDDGSRRAGGSAFYSALQAARLGQRTLIITRGRTSEIEELIEPYRDELALQVLPAPHTTTLRTIGSGSRRSQRMLAWAGPIDEQLTLDTAILHLAPVARESPSQWRGRADFVGLTPQGLARKWSTHGAQIESTQPAPDAAAVASACHAVVVNEHERASCDGLIATATAAGAVVAVTAGAQPNTILVPRHDPLELDVPALEHQIDDLGAGDVFAAAFFIALRDGRSALDAAVRISGPGADAIGGLEAIVERLGQTEGDNFRQPGSDNSGKPGNDRDANFRQPGGDNYY